MVAVFGWWKKKSESEPPLIAGPVGPRVKTYSAASGYVYQYAFTGQRVRPGVIEYIFDVSWDRTNRHAISVWVSDAALAPWSADNGRGLTSSERYGVAKMALRNAFDERAPSAMNDRIEPGSSEVVAILAELDV